MKEKIPAAPAPIIPVSDRETLDDSGLLASNLNKIVIATSVAIFLGVFYKIGTTDSSPKQPVRKKAALVRPAPEVPDFDDEFLWGTWYYSTFEELTEKMHKAESDASNDSSSSRDTQTIRIIPEDPKATKK